MKKILLIGNGAREHIIAKKLKDSRHDVELHAIGKALNPGIESLCESYTVGDYMDHDFVVNTVFHIGPDFVFIGPDDPIATGLADTLLEHGIKSVAPLKVVAQLEWSKSFTRDLLENHNIEGNPKFKVFRSSEGIKEYMEELNGNYVVKFDGLKGGKGVKVSGDHLDNIDEGFLYACDCLQESDHVVVEEKIIGQEFSLISLSDGATLKHTPVVQDHKRAFDGDTGPNTGGMGTYSDSDHKLPFITNEDVEAAKAMNEAVIDAVKDETGTEFKGILYGGFMAVKDGIRLIEYNARFGDPEAMNILTLLETDFVDVCEAIINGSLSELDVTFKKQATVCIYAVPEGYPTNSKKGAEISVGDVKDVDMYYGSVDKKDGALYLSGSRAIAFVATGSTIEDARAKAFNAVHSVKGPVFYRTDIATKNMLDRKTDMMKEVRS